MNPKTEDKWTKPITESPNQGEGGIMMLLTTCRRGSTWIGEVVTEVVRGGWAIASSLSLSLSTSRFLIFSRSCSVSLVTASRFDWASVCKIKKLFHKFLVDFINLKILITIASTEQFEIWELMLDSSIQVITTGKGAYYSNFLILYPPPQFFLFPLPNSINSKLKRHNFKYLYCSA